MGGDLGEEGGLGSPCVEAFVGRAGHQVPFARWVFGNADEYHALKGQRCRRKPRLGPRREPRRVWFRSIGGCLGGF